MFKFPHVTGCAKGLSVSVLIQSTAHYWDYVVKNEVFSSITPRAFEIFPVRSLPRGKGKPISLLLSRLRVMLDLQEHFVSVDTPSFFHGKTHLLKRFMSMLVAPRGACWTSRTCSFHGFKVILGLLIVVLAPERIVFAAHRSGDALFTSTSLYYTSLDVGLLPVKWHSTVLTLESLAASFHRHLAFSEKLGEFGEQPTIAIQSSGVNTEPSHACRYSCVLRGMEGLTTRQCGNNNLLTSAQRESDDIVWAAWQHAEVGHKQAIDNKADQTLNINPSQVFTAAEFPIRQAALAISISGLEELQNSSEEAIIDLLESRVENGERTFMNGLSNGIYGDGTVSSSIGGLQLLVAAAPSSGVVGGIDRASWTFWRNLAFSASGATTPNGGFGNSAMNAANVLQYMDTLWVQLIRGRDYPDIIIADNNTYKFYLQALQSIQRVGTESGAPDLAEAGFMSLKYMNADVVLDGGFQGNSGDPLPFETSGSTNSAGGAPATTMYFLNTNYIHFRPHSERNMVPLDPDRFSVNQDAMVRLIGWAGNMTMSNAFLQGTITT